MPAFAYTLAMLSGIAAFAGLFMFAVGRNDDTKSAGLACFGAGMLFGAIFLLIAFASS